MRSASVSCWRSTALILAVAVLATAWNPATARGGESADRLTRPLLLLRWVSLGLLVGVAGVGRGRRCGVSACADTFSGSAGSDLRAARRPGRCCCSACLSSPRCAVRGRRMRRRAGRRLRADAGRVHRTVRGVDRWLIGGGFSVGVGLWTAQVLGSAVLSTAAAAVKPRAGQRHSRATPPASRTRPRPSNADAPLIVPPPYFWAAVAIVLLILVAFVTGLCVWWWVTRRRARAELRAVLDDYPGSQRSTSARQAGRVVARMGDR